MPIASVGNPDFFNTCASDGWFVVVKENDNSNMTELIFGLRIGERLLKATVLQQAEKTDVVATGKLIQKSLFLEGVAEFLNAGGLASDMTTTLISLEAEAIFTATTQAKFAGWSYFDTGVDNRGNRIHEFISEDKNKFVRWVRNEYIDEGLTAEDMRYDTTTDGLPTDSQHNHS